MGYPGMVSLNPQTFDLVLSDIVHSMIQHGFRRFFILNGHSGNNMPTELGAINRDESGIRIAWYT